MRMLRRAKVAPATRRVTLEAFPERDEILRSKFDKKFPVLVRVTAPDTSDGTHVDLVAVLDMSASMTRDRLENVKEAMLAVIKDLGPRDRFCMLPFSSEVQSRTELTEMSLNGKEAASSMVQNLVTGGKSDMGAALQLAAKVLNGRKMHDCINRECLTVFISAGKDDSVYTKPINHGFPVHTIGLGSEHDPKVMHDIAQTTHGTYSYIDRDMDATGSTLRKLVQVQKAVSARNTEIKLQAHEGVTILSIESGGHKSVPSETSGVIKISRLYASQVSSFIVYLAVKQGKSPGLKQILTSGGGSKMELMTVSVTNEGVPGFLTGEGVPVDKLGVSVKRPEESPGGSVCPLVAAELYRLALVLAISTLAEPTADGLQKIRNKYLTSEQHRMYSKWEFEKDISEMQKGISDPNKHKMQGLPYMLSWLSSHNWQRPTAKGSPHMSDNFLPTSTMQQQHQQHQQQQHYRQQKHHQQAMFTEILLLLPCAISALVILLLAVFFGLHTAILNLMQSLHMRILSIIGTTVINHVMQYLYSAVMYSSILGSFSLFIPSGIASSIPVLQQKAEGVDTVDIKVFTNTFLPEGANMAANPKTCGGTAGMLSGKITVQGGLVFTS
nr:uncharacterized protein LOC127321442 [Lolium perenne]